MSFFYDVPCSDVVALQRALLYQKGILNATKEELTKKDKALEKAQKEKEEEIKVCKEEIGILKGGMKAKEEELTKKDKAIEKEQKEKEEAVEELKACKEEMGTLKGAMKAKEDELTKKDKAIEKAQKEKEEAVEEIKVCKEEEIRTLKGVMKAKEEELTRFREEVDRKRKAEEDSQREIIRNATRAPVALNYLLASVWKSSGSKVIFHTKEKRLDDSLNCAPLKSGTYEWKIRVHCAYSNCLRLGVIASSLDLPLNDWIGNLEKSWGYDCRGTIFYKSSINSNRWHRPEFSSGSVVHFVLDLTKKKGTLSVSVDESPRVEIFSEIKSSIGKNEGFLPAAAMWNSNAIELLDFKRL